MGAMDAGGALEVFNRKLRDFAEDLRTLRAAMPQMDVPALDVFWPALKLALSVDPTQPRRIFHDMVVVPYERRILDRDERFFLEEACYGAYGEYGLNLVGVLKQMWAMLSDADRTAIWAHLNVLLLLDRKVGAAAEGAKAPPANRTAHARDVRECVQ